MTGDTTVAANRLEEGDVRVTVRPFGPSAEDLSAIGERVRRHRGLRDRFDRGRARLLYVEALDDDGDEKRSRPQPPSRFRATVWDGEQQCAVYAEGSLADPRRLILTERAEVPPPSREEFDEAVRLVGRDRALGRAVRDGGRVPYQPIPAVLADPLPDGRVRRRIAVGLLPRGETERHEIVGVDLDRRRVHRLEEDARSGGRHGPGGSCGVPHDASQATATRGTAGQVWVTVSQGGQQLWRFLVVRPAASSGTNGSGVELRYVDYRRKRVLYRAHVPILNVKYDGNACGPYRDWQYQEGMIQAQGIDVAPGFRLCPGPALTIMDTGSDSGNFLGVGVYLLAGEIVLVSEMEAGWYRYVSQWRLGLDGVIRPRFGFAAVEHPCVCNVHHHHVYWRLDFDIRTAGRNRVREFNKPPLGGGGQWHIAQFETRRPRNYARSRRWRVENTRTREAYDLVPGAQDGLAAAAPDAPFGRGDVWVLRYRGSEIDDGVVAVGPPYEAGLDSWVDGEPVSDHDVVVWYGAHFSHNVNAMGPAQHGHVLGPDLRPVRW